MRILLWITFLLALPCLAAASHTVLNKSEKLTLRDKPSKTAPAVVELTPYQPVDVVKSEKGWSQVKTTQNQTGWVPSSALTENAFISVDEDQLNVRRGPGNDPATGKPYDVIMNYGRKFPLRVVDSADNGWLMIMDYEGDRGWVNPKLVKLTPHYVITKEAKVNVRKGTGIGQDLAFLAPKGFIMEVLGEKDDWLHVKCPDGDEGWLSAKTVFGWNDVTPPKPAEKADTKAADKGNKKDGGKKATAKAAKKDKNSDNSEEAGSQSAEAKASDESKADDAKSAKSSSSKSTTSKRSTKATQSSTRKGSMAKAAASEDEGKTTSKSASAKAGTRKSADKESDASSASASHKKSSTSGKSASTATSKKKSSGTEHAAASTSEKSAND